MKLLFTSDIYVGQLKITNIKLQNCILLTICVSTDRQLYTIKKQATRIWFLIVYFA